MKFFQLLKCGFDETVQGVLNISGPSIVSRGGEMVEACKLQICKETVKVCPRIKLFFFGSIPVFVSIAFS